SSWSVIVKWVITPTFLAIISYVVALPLLILLYRFSWARTFIRSGLLTQFPWLHEVILNTPWARWRLLESHARSTAQAQLPVAGAYIPQSLYLATDETKPITDLAASPEVLFSFGDRRALILG